MKQITSLRTLYTLASIAILSLLTSCGAAQRVTATPAEINTAVQDGQWRFTALRAQPQTGSNRQLTDQYWVEVKGGKVVFELPYFGQAQGPIGMPGARGPLEFSSTNYTITKTQKDNGSWFIVIKPQDNSEIISASFTFFDNQKADADFIMTNRTPISFSGYMEPVK
jgi:hypothetical protein